MIVRKQNIFYGLFGTHHSCYVRPGYFVQHRTISYNFGPSLNNYISILAPQCLKKKQYCFIEQITYKKC